MTRLTYCGNVHPSETLDGWIEACREHALPVAEARRAAGVRRFGLGAWWTAEVAAELVANPSARERVEAFLREADVELWTLNVFPYRGFHDPVVKEAVYRPDWADPARLRYTVDAVRAAASLVARRVRRARVTVHQPCLPPPSPFIRRSLAGATSRTHATERSVSESDGATAAASVGGGAGGLLLRGQEP